MKKFAALAAFSTLAACSSNPEKIIEESKLGIPVANIHARVETTAVTSQGDAADDPAFWVHPEAANYSVVLGTDKKQGLYVYDLEGRILQNLAIGRLNNVDVRQNLNGMDQDVAVASNRSDNSLSVFSISAEGKVAFLGGQSLNLTEPYGACLHRTPAGDLHAFVNDKDGRYQQWHISSIKPLNAELVREWALPSQPEGCVADDREEVIYMGEEAVGVWRLDLRDPNAQPELLTQISDGALVADVEGVDIYVRDNANDYLVVSSQGDFSYAIYELLDARASGSDALAYRGSFRVVLDVDAGIDGTQETDGLTVTNANLGGAWSQGMVVIQDGFNREPHEPQNFKYVAWKDIADALGL